MGNYAFIDGNNIHLGVKDLGWEIDYGRFRVYLKDKYNVIKVYYFIGYINKNESLYKYLREEGYKLIFKPTFKDGKGLIKGNCDAELVLQVMIDYNEYDKTIIITGDGDFTCLARYLQKKNKLRTMLAPNYQKCSHLLRKEIRNIAFINNLKHKIGTQK
jgi:uncharacterized LabA/DUF88 family protein